MHASLQGLQGSHVVHGRRVVPATGYIEMALAVAAQIGLGPTAIEDLALMQSLAIDDQHPERIGWGDIADQ